MKISPVCLALAGVLLAGATHAGAQPRRPFEAGVQVASVQVSEFDRADVGLGGRVAWRPVDALGLESEFTWYPGGFPGGRAPFSRSRVEGLFGATLGPTIRQVRPFVRFRSGFVRVGDAPEPYACILIYPPPLSCVLAAGRTLPAFDFGGGLEISATRRTFVRVDLGDRVVRYPGPSLDRLGQSRGRSFYSHDLRFAAGAGVRF